MTRRFGCNDKLIGAWNFVPAGPGLPASARDDDGHGSHTGSTTAGNQVEVTVSSPDGATADTVTISGVAPHANIVAYRVCGLAFGGSCGGAAIVAAINQAIADRVNTLNYSIGSTSPGDPWEDPDALAFLNARAAGIFVANSAGNAGPAPGTIGSPSGTPWMTTIGASEHNRSYAQTLTLSGGAAEIGPFEGKGFSGALATPTEIVYAGDVNGNNLCIAAGFPAGTDFTGQIVICDRGVTGRVEKSEVVAALGAEGFVLANAVRSVAQQRRVRGHRCAPDVHRRPGPAGLAGHRHGPPGDDQRHGPQHRLPVHRHAGLVQLAQPERQRGHHRA